jgi:hypothetical protein
MPVGYSVGDVFPAHAFDPSVARMGRIADDRAALIHQLQRAYSGELAAALAYRGHWRATPQGEDRARIRAIEEDEWHHRGLVGVMLGTLGAKPRFWLEVRAWLIGRTLGLLCHIAGWFLPMYGAGRLESRNVGEYERAARLAACCDRADVIDGLLAMAEVEWDHEAYFRSRVERHYALRWLPLWPPLPSRNGRQRAPLHRPRSGASAPP